MSGTPRRSQTASRGQAVRVLRHTDDDRSIVEAQLGRTLRGEWSVARRCHLGIPMVIENHPRLDDGSPFPTLFWLTCPILAKRTSTLEAEGTLHALTASLQRDAPLQQRLAMAIDRYRTRRDTHEVIEESGGPPGGGPERVKCLHTHLAHHLADAPNPIGALTLVEAGWPDCRQACYSTGSETP